MDHNELVGIIGESQS